MHARTLNLGILAHVDAGKTTLTERLLYAAGVIDELGSVDRGTTQTDTLALERQRGITIKAAVVSFEIGDVTVNLIDTPGHPDFIAEVERVLGVLDGAVLVISAVEGVQPQTRLLMRALQRLRVPTLLFVNKIDRPGADDDRVLEAIERRLTPDVVPMGSTAALGTRGAAFAPFGPPDPDLVERSHRADLYPAFFGSALTGTGTDELTGGIAQRLPARGGDADGSVSGRVFKIERGSNGDRIAYVRMFSGTVRVRDRLATGKVTAARVFASGDTVQRDEVRAGEIARLWGLEARIGDWIGEAQRGAEHHFAPPTVEAVVRPVDPADANRLRVALEQLAEQDPLIDVRQDADARLSVSLYGEVQQEVVQATLADEYGLAVEFSETSTICIERPVSSGEAVEILNTPTNPFHADLGLRIDRAAPGSGVDFRVDVDGRGVPLYLFKTHGSFAEHMEEYARASLGEGLYGWQVTDCVVTMTKIGYSSADGPPSRRGPMPTAGDLRKLTLVVLMEALQDAGSQVCEPYLRSRLEVPTPTIGSVMSVLGRLGAAVETPSPQGELTRIDAILPAVRANDLQRQLAGLAGGEGVLETDFEGYRPVAGDPPTRRRTTPNPLNREEFLMYLARRV